MKKYWPCLIVGICFFLIEFASPLAGDDYVFILNSEKNILQIVSQLYMTWSGRFLSNYLIIFIANKPVLWLICSTLLFSGIAFLVMKLSKAETLIQKVLLLLFVFGVSTAIRMETYSWMTGVVFYMIPLAASMLFTWIAYECYVEKSRNAGMKDWSIMIGCCAVCGLMMENIAAGMVVLNILLMIYTALTQKRFYIIHVLCAVVATAGFLTVMLSPGNAVRAVEYVEFNQLSLIGKMLYNFPHALKSTYLDNRMLVFVLSILLIRGALKNEKIKPALKMIVVLYLSIAVLTSLADTVKFWMDSEYIPYISAIYSIFYRLSDPNSLTTQLYWIGFTGYYLAVLVLEKKWWYFILSLFAYACNAAMLLSPIVGGRTGIYTLYFFYIIVLLMVGKLNGKKNWLIGLIVLAIGFNWFQYGKIYSNVYRIKQQQLNAVADYCNSRDCPKDYDYQVTLEPYPNDSIHTGNMTSSMHEKAFKQYYDITDWVLLNYDMETW